MQFFLLSLASVVALATNAPQRPCDILAAAGNPCVAAHSTTRALFAAYSGGLYNVTRASDGATLSVPVLGPGGFANKAAHDAFCPKLDCVISFVLDQSGNGNDLGQRHKLVNASQHPITAGGVPVYGMWFDPGYGCKFGAPPRQTSARSTTLPHSQPYMPAQNLTKQTTWTQPTKWPRTMSRSRFSPCFPASISTGGAALTMATASRTTRMTATARWRRSISGMPTGVATAARARGPGWALTSSRECTMAAASTKR
jgi:hypothetical protein